jgi:ketosteroid isomerase-like protein
MSEKNVAVLKRAIEAFSRGDKEAFLAEHHPECETIPLANWPEPGPYVGESQWDFYVQAEEIWHHARQPVVDMEIIDGGERAFARISRLFHIRGSEEPIEFNLYGAVSFREGKLARVQWFLDRGEALEAAGLSE